MWFKINIKKLRRQPINAWLRNRKVWECSSSIQMKKWWVHYWIHSTGLQGRKKSGHPSLEHGSVISLAHKPNWTPSSSFHRNVTSFVKGFRWHGLTRFVQSSWVRSCIHPVLGSARWVQQHGYGQDHRLKSGHWCSSQVTGLWNP